MIEWIKYDKNSREIESHVDHLITDGKLVMIAQHAKYVSRTGYGWYNGRYALNFPVTHWAKINLPGEDTQGISK